MSELVNLSRIGEEDSSPLSNAKDLADNCHVAGIRQRGSVLLSHSAISEFDRQP